MEGWVKLHRKLIKSEVFENEKLLKVFVWCMIKATRHSKEQVVGANRINLLPGQFVTGRRKAAMELGMKESTANNYLKRLEAMQMIHLNCNSRFTIVTIENYSFYQDDSKKVDRKLTEDEQKVDTNKKVKKEKNNNICRFTPPTLEEVQLYCEERSNGIDHQRFIDFYSSKGWKVGNTKMKDWKAAIRTWENRNKKSEPTTPNNAVNLDQNGYMPIDAI